MSDLSKLKTILNNQAKKTVKSGDWLPLEYEVSRYNKKEDRKLVISGLQIGFYFTESGRLLGIYNWKD